MNKFKKSISRDIILDNFKTRNSNTNSTDYYYNYLNEPKSAIKHKNSEQFLTKIFSKKYNENHNNHSDSNLIKSNCLTTKNMTF